LRESGIRRRFAEVLAANGYLILEASDWPSAVGKAMTLSPDVIALEASLLAPGGSEVARVLRNHERTAHIPIVALSDRSWRPSTLRTMGFDLVLCRPCSQFELLDTFARILPPDSTRNASGA
jgi:two-component system cell cycle response regulator DivK